MSSRVRECGVRGLREPSQELTQLPSFMVCRRYTIGSDSLRSSDCCGSFRG